MATSEGIIHRMTGQNGKLYLYEDRIVIERKGYIANSIFGAASDKIIPLDSVASVQFKKPGFFVGYLQFGIYGAVEAKSNVFNANEDENTVTFSSKKTELAISIKNYIENAISQRSKSSSVRSESIADEILKFKQLADSGVITQEEFEAKKKQLLGI